MTMLWIFGSGWLVSMLAAMCFWDTMRLAKADLTYWRDEWHRDQEKLREAQTEVDDLAIKVAVQIEEVEKYKGLFNRYRTRAETAECKLRDIMTIAAEGRDIDTGIYWTDSHHANPPLH